MTLRLLALLVASAIVGGCTINPDIRVSALERVSTEQTADIYALRVELRNPADEPMVLDRWTYSVNTNAGSWNSEWIASRTLPPRSITFESLPVVLRHDSTSVEVTDWRASGNLRFLRPGQLAETLFDLGVSRPDVDFSASGTRTSIGIEAPAVNSR
ncbi:MAG: hypothetical protein EXS15_03360 [Phycisphaerales bacterium]|nr:hypothetical protein [Phycisphaerales bacterium]